MSNVERARDLYAAFGRGDIETVMGGLDPEVEWSEAEGNPYEPSGAPFVGPQAVLDRLFKRLDEEWEEFIVTPETFHDAGSAVVVEGRYAGTFEESGRSLDAQFCHVLEFEGGKLKRFQQYVDTAQLQQVMDFA